MDLQIFFQIQNWASLVAQLVKNPPAMQEIPVGFLGQEDQLEKGQATHSSILGLPHDSAGKESACNARDLGSIPELGRSSGEGNGTHSSVLAWRIPWTEEPWKTLVHGIAKSQT